MNDIQRTLQKQRAFYNTGKTKDVRFRLAQLKKLRIALEASEAQIEEAMLADFGKCAFEVYTTEFSLVISEIKDFERPLKAVDKDENRAKSDGNDSRKKARLPKNHTGLCSSYRRGTIRCS